MFVFVYPGLALTAVVRGGPVIGGLEQALLTLALSVMAVILSGLALAGIGLPLTAQSWSITLAGITIVAVAVAVFGRRHATAAPSTPFRLPRPDRSWILWASAAGLAVAALIVARGPAPPDAVPGYTQLWMLPAGNADRSEVVIGVRSLELTEMAYGLRLDVPGSPGYDWQPIVLAPGDTWQQRVDVAIPSSDSTNVVATLYRLDDATEAYRRVTLHTEPARAS
jgi:uncharacterized membrane protein